MTRSTKTTIILLTVAVAVMTFLLVRSNHHHNVLMNTIQVNCQYGVVSSTEIDQWINALEEMKADTSAEALRNSYQAAATNQWLWNNNRLFSLAYLSSGMEEESDSLASIWRRYQVASSDTRQFFTFHTAEEINTANIDTLLGHMHELAEATAAFENYDFHQ
jgi:hypothetical protein